MLIFDTEELTNGENAVGVVGQTDSEGDPSFTTNNSNNNILDGTGFNAPRGVALDSSGHRLFVGDEYNHRVLVFELDDNNDLIDREADYVLGQPDFSSNSATTTASGLNTLRDIDYDDTNDWLFVTDYFNNRIVVYDVASITNGEDAIYVFGQQDFTSSVATTTQSGLNNPRGVYYESVNQYLYVGDYLKEYIKKRTLKKMWNRVIVPSTNKLQPSTPKECRETHYIDADKFPFNMHIKINKKRVILINLKEKTAVGIVIVQPEVVKNFQRLFDWMWSVTK